MVLPLSVAVLTGCSLALASSAHCAVMCGPLALAARVRHGPYAGTSYFLGRQVSYTLMGSLAGGAGHVLLLSSWARWMEAAFSWLLAASLLYTATKLVRARKGQRPIALGKGPRVSRVGLLLARVADEPLLLGAATALLPCAALFSAVVAAASLGTARQGAVAMTSFAVITGIVVVGVGQLASLRLRLPWFRQVVVGGLLIGAVVMLYRPIPSLIAGSSTPICHMHSAPNPNLGGGL